MAWPYKTFGETPGELQVPTSEKVQRGHLTITVSTGRVNSHPIAGSIYTHNTHPFVPVLVAIAGHNRILVREWG